MTLVTAAARALSSNRNIGIVVLEAQIWNLKFEISKRKRKPKSKANSRTPTWIAIHPTHMHNVDIDLVEMSLDVIKYAIGRISDTDPSLGFPKTADELKSLVGETITEKGIGGEKAFALFRDVLVKASVPDRSSATPGIRRGIANPSGYTFRPRHIGDERAWSLLARRRRLHLCGKSSDGMARLVDGFAVGAFGVFTSGGTEANLSAMVTAREYWRSLDPSREIRRGLVITSAGAHSSIKAMAKVIDVDVIFVDTEDRLEGSQVKDTIAGMTRQDRERTFAVIATARHDQCGNHR